MQVTAVAAEDVADWLQALGVLDVEVVYQARTVAVVFRGPHRPIRVPRGSWVVWQQGRVKHMSDAEFRRQFEREPMPHVKLIKLIDQNQPDRTVFHTVTELPPPGYVLDGTPWGPVEVCRFEHRSASTYVGDLYVVATTAPGVPGAE